MLFYTKRDWKPRLFKMPTSIQFHFCIGTGSINFTLNLFSFFRGEEMNGFLRNKLSKETHRNPNGLYEMFWDAFDFQKNNVIYLGLDGIPVEIKLSYVFFRLLLPSPPINFVSGTGKGITETRYYKKPASLYYYSNKKNLENASIVINTPSSLHRVCKVRPSGNWVVIRSSDDLKQMQSVKSFCPDYLIFRPSALSKCPSLFKRIQHWFLSGLISKKCFFYLIKTYQRRSLQNLLLVIDFRNDVNFIFDTVFYFVQPSVMKMNQIKLTWTEEEEKEKETVQSCAKCGRSHPIKFHSKVFKRFICHQCTPSKLVQLIQMVE
jgi:hypothetical protein